MGFQRLPLDKNSPEGQKAIDDYRVFLTDPPAWQAKRGLKRVEKGGTIK